ncbi:Glycoside-Pentoside-Hexuronide (GPH):Cation Symporter Family [Phytophthora cinnamomi]|uniref:Glycoside-Pentoside-Hexuronide (GPH):Cation Symporter Family n=1 Tax=Phytophthora cinnamomi TaxID=4785 RepID=UPI0035594CDF|nr:Glycoside-Pentoside-Hexuronide (GPH):Cation Symporter Family [Phytophthora cinnamomi]
MRAEAGSKVSGEGSHDFWDFCDGRADVFYLDRWWEHRQSAREFCSVNVYAEDEDDSTMEGEERRQQVNRKRRRGSQPDAVTTILERVNDLLDLETSESSNAQEDTWIEQKLYLQEQRAAQNLSTMYAMLDRTAVRTQQLLEQRREYIAQGLDTADIGQALKAQQAKKSMLEVQISALELQVLNGRAFSERGVGES